jgi:hypothetical protein
VRIFQASVADSTRTSYNLGRDSYLLFCRITGAAFPPNQNSLIGFGVYLFDACGKTPSTVRAYMTGLRNTCLEMNEDIAIFSGPRMARFFKGLARIRPNVRKEKRLPITAGLLALIFSRVWTKPEHLVLRACSAVILWNGMRAGEAAYKSQKYALMTRKQVVFDLEKFTLFLPESKVDYTRRGAYLKTFRSKSRFCAYTLLKEMVESAPLKGGDDPLFQWPDGRALTYRQLLGAIKAALQALGYDTKRYGTHSLRIGLATTLAQLGFKRTQIQAVARWTSETYLEYIQLTPDYLQRISGLIGAEGAAGRPVFGGLSPDEACNAEIDTIDSLFPNAAPSGMVFAPEGVQGPSGASFSPTPASNISAAQVATSSCPQWMVRAKKFARGGI